MRATRDPIYLDYNATTPIHPEVVEAILPFLATHFGNPSSAHVFGDRARKAVERSREQVAALLQCSPTEIIFTSGGTEANNLAIRGVAAAQPKGQHLLTSQVEHPATSRVCRHLTTQGWEVSEASVDDNGQVKLGDVEKLLRDDTTLVTIMLANNETGTLMPLQAVSELAHRRGILVHTDAAQAVGKIATRVSNLGVDLLSVAGHKLYAPKGVGALYVRKGTPIAPLLLGAGHERGMRPGTENVASIVGLGQACELAMRDQTSEASRQRALRNALHQRLSNIAGLLLNGHPEERLPNTLNVSFPAVRGSQILANAPGIAASTGSACHEGAESPSNVLLAQGRDPAAALGAVRLSLGRFTTADQVEDAGQALLEAYARAVKSKPIGQ